MEGRKKKEGRQNYVASGYLSSNFIFSNVCLNIFFNMFFFFNENYIEKERPRKNMKEE